MPRLTVIAATLTTASVLVGFYGMNLADPGINSGHKQGAFITLGVFVLIGLPQYWYFKRKGWV